MGDWLTHMEFLKVFFEPIVVNSDHSEKFLYFIFIIVYMLFYIIIIF